METTVLGSGGALADPSLFDQSAFDSYTQELLGGDPVLRFIKVGWYLQNGDDKQEVDEGTLVLADPSQARAGWLRFHKKALVERRLGFIGQGYKPEGRDTLGYDDHDEWELNEQGNPQDPWAATLDFPGGLIGDKANYKVLVGGTSWAWKACAGKLFQDWRAQGVANKGKLPVLKLGMGKKTTKRGPENIPVLTIDKWLKPAEVQLSELQPEGEAGNSAATGDSSEF